MAENQSRYDRDFLEWLVREQRNEEFAGLYDVPQDSGAGHMFLVTDKDVYTKLAGAEELREAILVGDQRLVSVYNYFCREYTTGAASVKTNNVMRHCVSNGIRRDRVN